MDCIPAPHSWGFLFVGGWVDLDMSRYLPLLLFTGGDSGGYLIKTDDQGNISGPVN